MKELFYPKSVVVVGVSEDPANMTKFVVENLLEFRFKGKIFLVGRKPGFLFGRKIYTALGEIRESIDVAVILTPAHTISQMLEECGRKKIRWAVIETGGFGEFSEEGAQIGTELLRISKKWGIRIVGPNGLGLLNAHNGFVLPLANLKRSSFRNGKVSILAQSGGVSFVYLDLLSNANIGVSKVVSMGNKLDLDEIDYLKYLIRDPETEIIGIYLEGLERGRELIDIARSTTKPIILHKANTGGESANIAKLHTAALANDDKILEAALRQAGIIRVKDFRSFINVVKILTLPPMKGEKIAIMSRSGGVAVVASDSAEQYGFRLAPMTKGFQRRIQNIFKLKFIQLTNPIDFGGLFNVDLYAKVIEQALKIKSIDGVVVLYAPTNQEEIEHSRRLIQPMKELCFRYGKPVLALAYYWTEHLASIKDSINFPIFTEIDDAMCALSISRSYHGRQTLQKKRLSFHYSVDRSRVKTLLQKAKREKRDPLLSESIEILTAYGIPFADYSVVRHKRDLEKAIKVVGTPVAMKMISSKISHKSDVGGVILDIHDLSGAVNAYDRIQKIGNGRFSGVLVQKMVMGGKEVILGTKRDPAFGPVVLFGLGGIYTEIFKDSSLRVVPIIPFEAEEMISELRGAAMLKGVRGERALDTGALVGGLLRLSQLMIDFPEIGGIDMNPVRVLGKGAMAIDARLLLNH